MQRFFSATRKHAVEYSKLPAVANLRGLSLPEGMEAATLASKVLYHKLCTYRELVDGTLTVNNLFEMVLIADILNLLNSPQES